jgi:transposase InsO family protein
LARVLGNHIKGLVAVDSFTVPSATFHVLFVFVVLAHHRRRVLHFNVTEHPTAEWTAQQVVEAFPWDTAPRYLLRDHDPVFGNPFRQRVAGLEVTEVLTAPRSPWQNPYVERFIGSIRREILDHVIILGESHLRRLLADYLDYYQLSRTHLSLDKDAPDPRDVQPPTMGEVVALPKVGGLHHRYERRTA